MPDWSAIIAALGDAGVIVDPAAVPTPVAGGDISPAWRLASRGGDVFLKTGPANTCDMFAAEAEGLAALAAAAAIRVPRPFAAGVAGATAFVALEWLELRGGSAATEARLGSLLAEQHRSTADRYGWHRDNTIGRTAQPNAWSSDWVEFYRDRRLGYQLELAARNGFGGELQREGERLMRRLPVFFERYRPEPSLLHGDLWGGNWASCDGDPVIFDPAVHYGDRECDIAMTRLFGGFGHAFHAAYETAWPLASGHRERRDLYQLYHVLNHLNLFGSGYHGRALELIRRLL
ncbi:MAG TPA: fructosamine kinase family protein [Woeseiaceae bacterium]